MKPTESKNLSEVNRLSGKHQVDEKRVQILDAAEKLFLEKGIVNTSMVEIARAMGITKVTLYRYFANKDEIAIEIQIRMLNKISAVSESYDMESTREVIRNKVHLRIEYFDELRDAYRYAGMFDQIYLDNPSDSAISQWTKEKLATSDWKKPDRKTRNYPYPSERSVIMSSLVWFLEKLALRGELTWSDEAVPLEDHLKIFEDMIMAYLDKLEQNEQE